MSHRIEAVGVRRIADNALILRDAPGWADYAAWLRAGGKPLPPLVKPKFANLAAAQAEVAARIGIARDRREAAGLVFRGRRIATDAAARARLHSAGIAALVATVTRIAFARDWAAADGGTLNLDAAGMLALLTAIAELDNACHARARELRAAVAAAASLEALESIDITTGWTE